MNPVTNCHIVWHQCVIWLCRHWLIIMLRCAKLFSMLAMTNFALYQLWYDSRKNIYMLQEMVLKLCLTWRYMLYIIYNDIDHIVSKIASLITFIQSLILRGVGTNPAWSIGNWCRDITQLKFVIWLIYLWWSSLIKEMKVDYYFRSRLRGLRVISGLFSPFLWRIWFMWINIINWTSTVFDIYKYIYTSCLSKHWSQI